MADKKVITIKSTVDASIDKVWKFFTEPKHIKQWNNASEDWHTTVAENDLRAGGRFLSRMEAKNGSFGFDFSGTYDEVKTHELIAYTLDDERKVNIIFTSLENEKTEIVQSFEAEDENPVEMQQSGWQSILDNFEYYTEKHVI